MSGAGHDKFMQENRAHWDEVAAVHPHTEFYDVTRFKSERTQLDSVVLEQLGDIAVKSVLHLQCHFGMDTIRLAWLGANPTGVDFSPVAIETAKALATEVGVRADFVCSNIYELPHNLEGQFDVVFTSHGVLSWLPDIRNWAHVVAHFLRPGGRFVIVEGHPAMFILDDDDESALSIRYPYFNTGDPLTFEYDGTYADANMRVSHKRTHNWNHPLGDIINALIDSGLRIAHVGEYPFCSWRMVPLMEQGADGWWRLPQSYLELPWLFSIQAIREA
jgi:SAM-dependent methyltransferase